MIVAPAMRDRLPSLIAHHDARLACLDGADARNRKAKLLAERRDGVAARSGRGEDQLVVVAARKEAGPFQFRVAQRLESGRARNAVVFNHRAHARALDDVAEVAGQAVGDVDRRVSEAPQPLAELDARLGPIEAFLRFRNLRVAQRQRRAAELAGNPDVCLLYTSPSPRD